MHENSIILLVYTDGMRFRADITNKSISCREVRSLSLNKNTNFMASQTNLHFLCSYSDNFYYKLTLKRASFEVTS